ncbi:CHAT domain-containing protein [Streptomyces sp. KLOTTS4A1]|uniref:CHAT domain-containing protein n=1 Tax=Streptomyces sp. KLOTTS4A1 TaxID=3390996 RepID=UPI0039F4E309
MAQLRREQFIEVVEELARRWLRGTERDLPIRMRARLIGERALDSYETTRRVDALTDAVAASSAADALGAGLPSLRRRLDQVRAAPAPHAEAVRPPVSEPVEPDTDRLDQLNHFLRSQTGESRREYRPSLPALEAARGYEGEARGVALLLGALQFRDVLDAHPDRNPSSDAYTWLSADERRRLLQALRTRSVDELNRVVDPLDLDQLQTSIESSTGEERPWGWSFTPGDLALTLLLRHELLREPDDLDRAVADAEAAVRFAEQGGEQEVYLTWLTVLGTARMTRYGTRGGADDLKAAADVLWETTTFASEAPVAPTARTDWFRAVGTVQRSYYAISGELSYLHRAVDVHGSLIWSMASSPPARGFSVSPAAYASLGYSFLALYERSADSGLLEQGVDALAEALRREDTRELGPGEWTEWTTAYVSGLQHVFRTRGSRTALERLIGELTGALSFPDLPQSSPARTVWLGSLGEALLWRYEFTREEQDLRAARNILGRMGLTAVLAAADHAEYLRTSDLTALDRAVTAAVGAVRASAGPDGAHLPTALQLAQSLIARAEVLRAPDDAAAAADLLDHCLEWQDQPAEQLALQSVEYGHALLVLHKAESLASGRGRAHHHDTEVLGAAAEALIETVEDPRFPKLVKTLAVDFLALAMAWGRERRDRREDGYDDDRDAALWRTTRIVLNESARRYGQPLQRRGIEELRGFPEVIRDDLHARAVDVLMRRPSAQPTEQARLVMAEAEDLAHRCLEAGEYRAALEVVESGRAMLVETATGTDATGDRTIRHGLSSARERWLEALPAIGPPAGPQLGIPMGGRPVSLPEVAAGRRLLPLPESERDSLRDALGDIISAPTPEDIVEMCRALGIDAVVHLLAGRRHGWALVTHRDGTSTPLRLPHLREHATELVHFMAAHDQRLRARNAKESPSDSSWRKALRDVCDWAWKAAIESLSHCLTERGIKGTPRVVIIPSGALGLVPWHAARYRVSAPGGGAHRFAVESMAFSYAPSAQALSWYADRALPQLTGSGVVVVDPTDDLPHARQEGEDIFRWHYSKGQRLSSSGRHGAMPATPRAVLGALNVRSGELNHPVVHFACHAQSLVASGESHLVLAGGQRLSVATILDRPHHPRHGRRQSAQLIVLSACATAVPGAHYDSALSLTTAFAATGASAVVGSLWAVNDAMTAALMRDFHALLNLDEIPPAEALRTAQLRALRNARARPFVKSAQARTRAEDPWYWAAFVHQGLGHSAAVHGPVLSSVVAPLPDSGPAGSGATAQTLRLPIFASLPGSDPSAIVWRCPVDGCPEKATGDMDSPFDADCCPAHPSDAFVLA